MTVEISARMTVALGLRADQLAVLVQELVTRVDTMMRDEHLAPLDERARLMLAVDCVGIEDQGRPGR